LEGKNVFIENDITRYVYTSCGYIYTFYSFMHGAIAKKNTLLGAKSELVFVIGMKVLPTSAAKDTKSIIIRRDMKKALSGRLKINNFARKQVNEKSGSEKSFVPIFERHGRIGKQGKTNFDYMAVFAFSRAILLVSMRT
jgi:hypothetical protein